MRYHIDAQDIVTFVDASWIDYASANGAPELSAASVVGKSIWDFLADNEVNHLYDLLFASVRMHGTQVMVPFRCDSPNSRRYMELSVSPLAENGLEIVSTLVREEARPTVELMQQGERDPDHFLTICSWCKRVKLEGDKWVEVEAAVRKLNLFALPILPGFTHGVCSECADLLKAKIAGMKPAPANGAAN